MEVEHPFDDGHAGTVSGLGNSTEAQIVREGLTRVLSIDHGLVGLLMGGTRAEGVCGGEVDELEDVGMAEADAFGAELGVE